MHNAPYDCAKRRTIDGTSFRVRLHVPVTGGVRVTFNLDQPRQGVTDVHVQLDAGIDGPVSVDRAIQLAPDATTAQFHLGNLCVVDGVFDLSVQLDDGKHDRPVASPYVRRPPRSDSTAWATPRTTVHDNTGGALVTPLESTGLGESRNTRDLPPPHSGPAAAGER